MKRALVVAIIGVAMLTVGAWYRAHRDTVKAAEASRPTRVWRTSSMPLTGNGITTARRACWPSA